MADTVKLRRIRTEVKDFIETRRALQALDGNIRELIKESVGAPIDANYVTFPSTNSLLTNERKLTAGNLISLTDGGANGNVTIDFTGIVQTKEEHITLIGVETAITW